MITIILDVEYRQQKIVKNTYMSHNYIYGQKETIINWYQLLKNKSCMSIFLMLAYCVSLTLQKGHQKFSDQWAQKSKNWDYDV